MMKQPIKDDIEGWGGTRADGWGGDIQSGSWIDAWGGTRIEGYVD